MRVELTTTYGTGLEKVVEAFQRHFRKRARDGRADTSTRDTLSRLLSGDAGKRRWRKAEAANLGVAQAVPAIRASTSRLAYRSQRTRLDEA